MPRSGSRADGQGAPDIGGKTETETNGTKPLGGHTEHMGRRKCDPIILPETENKGNALWKSSKKTFQKTFPELKSKLPV